MNAKKLSPLGIYSRLIIPQSEIEIQEEPPQEESAAHYQARVNWSNSSITKELIEKIEKDICLSIDNAIMRSLVCARAEDAMNIVKDLVKVNELRKIHATLSQPQPPMKKQ